MRPALLLITMLAARTFLAVPLMAQGYGPPINSRGPGGLWLNKGVQKELKLTPEQVAKLEAIEDFRLKRLSAIDFDSQSIPEETRSAIVRESKKRANEENAVSRARIVNPEQLKRFMEIVTQERGFEYWLFPPVADRLKCSDVQRATFKTLNDELISRAKEIQGLKGLDPETRKRRIADLRTEILGKGTALLTPDQFKIWSEMTGKPFAVEYD